MMIKYVFDGSLTPPVLFVLKTNAFRMCPNICLIALPSNTVTFVFQRKYVYIYTGRSDFLTKVEIFRMNIYIYGL